MSFAQPVVVEDLLNYKLSRLLASSGSMVTRLCEGRYGITRREWRLICILAAQDGLSPSALAQRAHLTRARISRHIADLTEKKLVSRKTVATDKRRWVVSLTASGRTIYDELFPQSVKFNNMVLGALAPAELRHFDAALKKLTDVADALSATVVLEEKADRRHGGSRRFSRATFDDRLW
ncbi:MarR family winged helix-turn-helix transcriptional regulator [Variovorax sp. GT1P44]|uniref:MarR family winged helix-turn-helix transcriptional regulator n=1 Tax=Variovorax sp. GT1P44 TaxID=3443742 RepID=UPI003F45C90D